jgi:hypothetical protein
MQAWKQKIDGGNMKISHSRPNESTQAVQLPTPHVVRVVGTIRVELPANAKASTLRTDTSTPQSKGSSRQIAAFFIEHPILALSLITLTGFICILLLPPNNL